MKLLNLSKRLGVSLYLALCFGTLLQVSVSCAAIPKKPLVLSPTLDWPFERFRVNQEFGLTAYADRYASGSHWGMDITHGAGASIRPIADGVVVAISTRECPDFPDANCNSGQGNWVLLEHPQLKTRSFYGHLNRKPNLKPRDLVSKGDVIGYEGRSGRIFNLDGTLAGERSETHLHLSMGDIRPDRDSEGHSMIRVGTLQNPRDLLPPISRHGR